MINTVSNYSRLHPFKDAVPHDLMTSHYPQHLKSSTLTSHIGDHTSNIRAFRGHLHALFSPQSNGAIRMRVLETGNPQVNYGEHGD